MTENDLNDKDMVRRRPPRRSKRFVTSLLIGLITFSVLFYVPLPFFIYMPGTAEAIHPMVQVPDETNTEEKGDLMLVTVRVANANIVTYLWSLANPYDELQLKKDVLKGMSERDYSQQQQFVMLTSQSEAIQAAYRKANIPYRIKGEGILVTGLTAGMPAEKHLQTGDKILKADDKEILSSKDLLSYIEGKKEGEMIEITYLRGDKTMKASMPLGVLPPDKDTGTRRVGIGISLAEMQSVQAEKEDKQVVIKAGEIGGPSAGLMFSLEIYNQLMPGDITKGHKIAGTGTINPDGTVGVIGGIKHKIIAADKEGAEIFFAPQDLKTDKGTIYNYTAAVERAKEIDSKMKIVPVATMEDALKYLASLPPK
ncbi:SepM family pheromone-processing serine protease [Paenibacillus lutrae]|uniref:endopeptidase La n=1 Tax=Paenibacillus lutrae TaxID=2078573 RepID=A0A7X3FGE5_9BACL|nr:SepM family pheromone-processing serine protease [Paenibacillus lutrae]MVO99201.1 PDZ domain-containing protein [Paenibacillus lutrae]